MVRQWAEQAGHTIVLVVTSPGPKTRRSDGFKQIATTAGEHNIEVLITTRLKTVATPILFFGSSRAKAHIAGQDWLIERLDLVEAAPTTANPGSIIERWADGLIVQAGDGAVKIKATPYSEAASL